MLDQLGKDLAEQFEDVKFIGVQRGDTRSILLFNCNKTGATFSGFTINEIEERLSSIRNNIETLDKSV